MTLSVLLIEDSPLLRRSLRDMLATLPGVQVAAELARESEALQWLAAHPAAADWQLAIVDLVLEQGTGMAVISACREQTPPRHVVVFSDYATPEVRAHCLKLGADAVFRKGIDGAALAGFCAALAAPG